MSEIVQWGFVGLILLGGLVSLALTAMFTFAIVAELWNWVSRMVRRGWQRWWVLYRWSRRVVREEKARGA